jgi:hypothetical protein
MPPAPSGDPIATIWKMVAAFQKDVQQLVDGRPESGTAGLIQIFRKSREQFRETIFYQAPCFKPFEEPRAFESEEPVYENMPIQGHPRPAARVLVAPVHEDPREEDLEPPGRRDPKTFVYLDEVLHTAKKSVFAPHIIFFNLSPVPSPGSFHIITHMLSRSTTLLDSRRNGLCPRRTCLIAWNANS